MARRWIAGSILRSLLPILVSTSIFLAIYADPAATSSASPDPCSTNSSLGGSEFDMIMVQHQLRGVITVLDSCSFSVRGFDMLQGSDDVRWWGAIGEDFDNFTSGFVVADQPLNHTYKNESFTVRLSSNKTWNQIPVLSVWDRRTESDFGHVLLPVLENSIDDAAAPSSELSPSPAASLPADATGGPSMARKHIYRPQPTTFDNCKILSARYRLRWSLNPGSDSIDIGLEAAVGSDSYMAFGWGAPSMNSPSMINSDIVVAGFTDEGLPFAEDYFISEYSECLLSKDGKVQGVCPDTIYEGSDPIGLVNNSRLVYGHRKDGVSFIRYRRPLGTRDEKYDVAIQLTENMTVVWALGLIRPPDSLRPYYLPQNHGSHKFETYGYLTLNVSADFDDCLGPLDAEDKEDQDLIFADGKTVLNVLTGPAMHYPNPPNPDKVLYINKKEAPILRVERGVPVKFSIQAGHDVALYITSDPIGGNVTSRNGSETIYAGGPEFEGVPASPKELVWRPDRKTPDLVYYHSVFAKKMGWKIQVVDGGLSDMYNNSVLLDDQQVTFFWTLSDHSISIAARGEKKSGYVAIGFGSGMVNSFVYVGWMDNAGTCHVRSYWIDGKDAAHIHPTDEDLTDTSCSVENGIVTFEFTRPLSPSCTGRIECKNVIDPTTPLRIIWAMGARWADDNLSEKNMHSITSHRPVRVMLMHGSAEAEQDLRPVLAVHGFMMFIAWGMLLPGGILAARYLKSVKGDGWFQIHVYLQYSGIAVVFLGLLFAAAELRGFFISSIHVKLGLTAIILACAQPVNAYLRPKRPENGEAPSTKRIIWEYLHIFTGRSAIIIGIAALVTGLKHLKSRYGDENIQGLKWTLIIWFSVGTVVVLYLEYVEMKRSKRDSFRGNWVLGNEEDDSADLLAPNGTLTEHHNYASDRMEIQLEPVHS